MRSKRSDFASISHNKHPYMLRRNMGQDTRICRPGEAGSRHARIPLPHLTTTPKSNAANSRNNRHCARLDCTNDGEQVRLTAHGVRRGHLLDVSSRTEGLVSPSYDDQRHRLIILRKLESLEYAGAHVVTQGVEGRLAQPKEENAVVEAGRTGYRAAIVDIHTAHRSIQVRWLRCTDRDY